MNQRCSFLEANRETAGKSALDGKWMNGAPFLQLSKLSLLSLKSSIISLWRWWVLIRAKHLAIGVWSLAGTVCELGVTFAICLCENQDLSHCLQHSHSLLFSSGTEIRDKFTYLSVLWQKLLIVNSVSWQWMCLIKYIIPQDKILCSLPQRQEVKVAGDPIYKVQLPILPGQSNRLRNWYFFQ